MTRLRAALTALFVTFACVASAYLLLPFKWTVAQVPYYINPQNGDVPADIAEAAIRYGADAWSLQTTAPISLYYMGRTTDTVIEMNQRNAVFFREGFGNGIAVTYSWASGSTYLEFDIVFYDGVHFFAGTSGCYAPGWYIEDIATHEFGHGLGLHHSDVLDATMYPGIYDCSQHFRSLSADDIAGIEALYPIAPPPPPPPPPTEICGDGIDNDGDGEVDEGCSPPPAEICGDHIDNDGDGQVDEGCPKPCRGKGAKACK